MTRQEEDAYPSRRVQSRSKIKAVICISLLFICLGSLITTVAAPGDDDYPDPLSAPDTIFNGNSITELPMENLVRNHSIFVT